MDKIEMRWSKWKTNCLIKREGRGGEGRGEMWGEQSFGSDLSWLAHDEFFFSPSRGNSISVQNGIFFFFFGKLQQI